MVPDAAPAKPMNELQRLAGVLVDPKPAFADISARPRWWTPLILLILAATVFTYCYSQRVGWEGFLRQQMESNSSFQQMPADQRERIIEQQTRFASMFGYVRALVTIPLNALLVAGVMALVFRVMLSANLTFKQLFAATSYSLMPGFIASLLSILVLYLKNPEDFNLRNPLAFNLGAYLSSDSPKFWMSVASSIDLFAFWSILLLATGISAADRKLRWTRCLTWIVACWLVWVLGKSAFAAKFG